MAPTSEVAGRSCGTELASFDWMEMQPVPRVRDMPRWRRLGAGMLMTLAVATHSPAGSAVTWRVSEGGVRVVCPLTVGGSFEARTTALTGSLTSASGGYDGSLAVDLRTLDTGIGLRNTHMRENYLEVQRGDGFERAVLSELRLASPAAETAGGRTAFSATLLLHGVSRKVEGEAVLSRRGQDVRVEATFPIDLTEFGIASPRYLGVGVRDRVTVKASFVSTPTT